MEVRQLHKKHWNYRSWSVFGCGMRHYLDWAFIFTPYYWLASTMCMKEFHKNMRTCFLWLRNRLSSRFTLSLEYLSLFSSQNYIFIISDNFLSLVCVCTPIKSREIVLGPSSLLQFECARFCMALFFVQLREGLVWEYLVCERIWSYSWEYL